MLNIHVHGKYVYSTLALGKEREIVKEETALRKEKEAVCCYVHISCTRMRIYIQAAATATLLYYTAHWVTSIFTSRPV